MGRPRRFASVSRLKDPGDWGGGLATHSWLPCSGRGHFVAAAAPEGGHLPPGAPGCLSSRGHRRGTSPLPSSGRPGTCLTCLLPFSNTTPTGLWSPRERDRAGTKGSLFSGSRGGGSRARSRFPAPLGDGQAPRLRASPSLERRPPRPQRLRSGRGAPGHRGFFSGGRAARRRLAGSAARGGTVGVLGAGGGGGGGRGSLRPGEPGGAGRAPRALSGLLLAEPRRLEPAPSLLPSSPFSRAAPSPRRAPLPCRHHAPLLPSWHFPLEPSFWTNFDGEFHTTLEKCRL